MGRAPLEGDYYLEPRLSGAPFWPYRSMDTLSNANILPSGPAIAEMKTHIARQRKGQARARASSSRSSVAHGLHHRRSVQNARNPKRRVRHSKMGVGRSPNGRLSTEMRTTVRGNQADHQCRTIPIDGALGVSDVP